MSTDDARQQGGHAATPDTGAALKSVGAFTVRMAGAAPLDAELADAVAGATHTLAAVGAAKAALPWTTVPVPFGTVLHALADSDADIAEPEHGTDDRESMQYDDRVGSGAGSADGVVAPSVVAAAAACAAGDVTATQLVSQALTAARGYTGTAFVRIRQREALATAATFDQQARDARHQAPLAGVPIACKDMFFRAGEPSACGSVLLREFVPDHTATVVRRLEAAGAVDVGALHMAEFAMSPTGLNAHFGQGRNPWSSAHVSGGSSSGSGVAVGARLVSAALGSDTGGSVRLPAAICGVTGIKPTQNLVSVHGVMPLAPSLDCVGFLAQSARDCARLLSVVVGPDPDDASCIATADCDYEAGIGRPLSAGVRIAVPAFESGPLLSQEVLERLQAFTAELNAAGVTVVPVSVPQFDTLAALSNVVLGTEAASVHQHWLATQPQAYGRQVRRRIERGLLYPASRYLDAVRLRPRMLADFLASFMPQVDALLLPVLPYAVPTIDATTQGDEKEIEARFGGLSYWTRAINYLGLPALALPAGRTPDGLPCGVQLVGRPFGEKALFRIGHQYQLRTAWHLDVPPGETARRTG